MLYFNEAGDLVAGFRNIWGDWAMHLTQAHAFAYQPFLHVIEHHPIMWGIPLTYPFIINLLSGLLLRLGVGVISAFIVPSIFFTFCLLLVLYLFGKAITQSSKAALLGISLFLTSGGLGFGYYVWDLYQDFSWQRAFYPPHEYTHIKEIGYWWTTTMTAHLMPQRAFLLGLIVGLVVLGYLYHQLNRQFANTKPKALWVIGLIVGSLAILHSHSLIVMAIVSAWLAVWNLRFYKYWLYYGVGAATTAIPLLLFLQTGHTSTAEQLKWLPGWLANAQELNIPVVWFWLKNWGVFLPVFIVAFVSFIRREVRHNEVEPRTWNKIQLITAFICLFILANLIRFQPSTWDNAKLFLWVYLMFSFVIAQWLVNQWYSIKQGWGGIVLLKRTALVLLILILTASGTIDLVRVLNTSRESFVMISAQEIELAKAFRAVSQPDDLALTSDNHLHWVSVIAGRRILLGYKGWLWSHGIDYQQLETDIRSIYQGLPNAQQLVNRYEIDYVVTDDNTRKNYQSNDAFFIKHYQLIIRTPQYSVFKI